MEVLNQIDDRLKELKELKSRYEKIAREAQAEVEKVKAAYQPRLSQLEEEISKLDKSIKEILKNNKILLFGKQDTIELSHGACFYRAKFVVHRGRSVLGKLKELGYTDAIKVVESVKWEVLEKWPDEKLNAVGTKRKLKESFEYEIR